MRQLRAILPVDTHTYRGAPWVARFYVFLALVITFRSLVYVFQENRGAASVVDIDLDKQASRRNPPRCSQPEPSAIWSSMTTCPP
ncbi:MAG: hypothetical protein F4Y11_06100 [Chloroflexi bacterium]|nr:hypothetical protein [Chloroflexota bacterium]